MNYFTTICTTIKYLFEFFEAQKKGVWRFCLNCRENPGSDAFENKEFAGVLALFRARFKLNLEEVSQKNLIPIDSK